jgi:ABC-type uncharacterized transport system ATPase component
MGPLPGKAEVIPGIIPVHLHREVPVLTGLAQKILILLLPIPEAAAILLLQDHTARLLPDHQAEGLPGQAAAAEAAAAVAEVRTAVVAVVHAAAGNNLKTS